MPERTIQAGQVTKRPAMVRGHREVSTEPLPRFSPEPIPRPAKRLHLIPRQVVGGQSTWRAQESGPGASALLKVAEGTVHRGWQVRKSVTVEGVRRPAGALGLHWCSQAMTAGHG